MALTPYSFLTAVLWSSVFVIVLLMFRGRKKIPFFAGLTPCLLLAVGVLLRVFLPIEIFSFTKTLGFAGPVAFFYRFFLQPSIDFVPSKLLTALFWIWLCGFLFYVVRFFARYLRFSQRVSCYDSVKDKRVERMALQAAERLNTKAPRLMEVVFINTPQVLGFFRPMVLLPTCEYTDEEYEFVFLHELQHWKTHDLWVKLLAELYCAVFWWNPLSYALKRSLAETLELRCDENVLKLLSEEESYEYALVLQKTLIYELTHGAKKKNSSAINDLSGKGERAIYRRFKRLTDVPLDPKKKKRRTAIAVVFCILLFFASYTVVIQPRYQSPAKDIEAGGYISVDPATVYFISRPDGDYDFYFGNKPPRIIEKKRAEDLIEIGFQLKEK